MSLFQQNVHQLRGLKQEPESPPLLKLLRETLTDLLDAADYADKHGYMSKGAVVSMVREDLDALEQARDWAIQHGYKDDQPL